VAEISVPGWIKDAVFYQIFPDRFARSASVEKPSNLEPWDSPPTAQGYKGGDLVGIVERLDYLQELGINAIYLNPIFQATSSHRYNTHDYFQVDPILGGNKAFHILLEQLHRRGMRVILDGVFNHAGRGFLQFSDILENGSYSAWLDWFVIEGWPISAYDGNKPANYQSWHGRRELPALNLENPQVQEYIFQVAEHWIAQGIDGWRLDSPSSVQVPGFWEEFRRRVKQLNPDTYLVGEIWRDGTPWLQGDRFDGVTNYLFAETIIAFAAGNRVLPELIQKPNPKRDYYPFPALDAVQFGEKIESLLELYPSEITHAQLNLLNSHDTPRLLTLAQGDVASVKLATLFQMSYPGVPCIFYGDEIGLAGGPDPDCRRAFPWEDRERWNEELLDFFKTVIRARHRYRALRHGSYTRLHAAGSVYAFARHTDDEAVIVVLNTAESPCSVTLPVANYYRDGQPLTAHLAGREVVVHDRCLVLEIAGRQGELVGPTQ
jgi:cyclomaltodextrinase